MHTIAIIGLGYVGLPLAVEFGRVFKTIGYDLSLEKIEHFKKSIDPTGEVTAVQFQNATHLTVTNDPSQIKLADIVIVAVPTPVDNAHRPDFSPLEGSSSVVGKYLKAGATVIYESTVYPGATEEICIPILEKESGKKWKKDFFVGYSPERINPGDKEHTLTTIVKVVSGDCPETLEKVASVYAAVIKAGVYKAASIKVAEAAKVIENTQRDLNIALMNELSMIFNRVGIDTLDVLNAAGTKWNFLPFRPGLVGGHCIGVDPYYLTHKAEQVGYIPQVILAGRRINDAMGPYVARQAVKQMIKLGHSVQDAQVTVLGLTFKENVPDLRNSKVIDLIREFESFGIKVNVCDPIAEPSDAIHEYGISLIPFDALQKTDCVVLAVNHKEFLEGKAAKVLALIKDNGLLVDIKSAIDPTLMRASNLTTWRL